MQTPVCAQHKATQQRRVSLSYEQLVPWYAMLSILCRKGCICNTPKGSVGLITMWDFGRMRKKRCQAKWEKELCSQLHRARESVEILVPNPKSISSVLGDAFFRYVSLIKPVTFCTSYPKVITTLFEFSLNFPCQGPITKACTNRYCEQDDFFFSSAKYENSQGQGFFVISIATQVLFQWLEKWQGSIIW